MEYWQGIMNWPLDKDWKCEICSNRSLIWGVVHAQCRCDTCHVEYTMRDFNDRDIVLTIPFCALKPEYFPKFKAHWEKTQTPLSEITDDEWDVIMEAV